MGLRIFILLFINFKEKETCIQISKRASVLTIAKLIEHIEIRYLLCLMSLSSSSFTGEIENTLGHLDLSSNWKSEISLPLCQL